MIDAWPRVFLRVSIFSTLLVRGGSLLAWVTDVWDVVFPKNLASSRQSTRHVGHR